jgi:hypothetical protein
MRRITAQKFVPLAVGLLDPAAKPPSNAASFGHPNMGPHSMDPKHSDAMLSRFLGDTLEQGSLRMIGAIAALALVISVIVYII